MLQWNYWNDSEYLLIQSWCEIGWRTLRFDGYFVKMCHYFLCCQTKYSYWAQNEGGSFSSCLTRGGNSLLHCYTFSYIYQTLQIYIFTNCICQNIMWHYIIPSCVTQWDSVAVDKSWSNINCDYVVNYLLVKHT